MEFSNLIFLYILFPLSVLIYFLLPDMRKRNWFIIGFSMLLYSLGQPFYMLVLLALSFLNYKLALHINPEERSTMLMPVLINLVVLAFFKYLGTVLKLFGIETTAMAVFPLGISLYTFSVVSYLVDIYNRKIDPEEKFQNLLLYLLMFPKLFQGPIVRYSQMASQLENRKHSPRGVYQGIRRFLFGLAKKVLLADGCGRILAEVNGMGADNTLIGVWFAAILFLFQIYYDFSGYADMAIGLGNVFGFRYGENFNRPYMSLSVTEFCGRWNMSMHGFFRDYVYLPMGGDQLGKVRQLLNMFVVCLMAGVWHGISWNFVLWGVYLFAVLAVEDYFASSLQTMSDGLCRCITLWLLLVGGVIFSHENFAELQSAAAAMLGYGGMGVEGLGSWIWKSIPLLVCCFVGCTYVPVYAKRIFAGVCGMGRKRVQPNTVTPLRILYLSVSLCVMALLIWLCTVSLVQAPALPFLYSRF